MIDIKQFINTTSRNSPKRDNKSNNEVYKIPLDKAWEMRKRGAYFNNNAPPETVEKLRTKMQQGNIKPIQATRQDFKNGVLNDGKHRLIIAQELGMQTYPIDIRTDKKSRSMAVAWKLKSPLHYEEMTPDEYLRKAGKPANITIRGKMAGSKSEEKSIKVSEFVDRIKDPTKAYVVPAPFVYGWTQEGRHRAWAAKKAGLTTIPVATYKYEPEYHNSELFEEFKNQMALQGHKLDESYGEEWRQRFKGGNPETMIAGPYTKRAFFKALEAKGLPNVFEKETHIRTPVIPPNTPVDLPIVDDNSENMAVKWITRPGIYYADIPPAKYLDIAGHPSEFTNAETGEKVGHLISDTEKKKHVTVQEFAKYFTDDKIHEIEAPYAYGTDNQEGRHRALSAQIAGVPTIKAAIPMPEKYTTPDIFEAFKEKMRKQGVGFAGSYNREWQERFASGRPLNFMGKEARKAYAEVLLEKGLDTPWIESDNTGESMAVIAKTGVPNIDYPEKYNSVKTKLVVNMAPQKFFDTLQKEIIAKVEKTHPKDVEALKKETPEQFRNSLGGTSETEIQEYMKKLQKGEDVPTGYILKSITYGEKGEEHPGITFDSIGGVEAARRLGIKKIPVILAQGRTSRYVKGKFWPEWDYSPTELAGMRDEMNRTTITQVRREDTDKGNIFHVESKKLKKGAPYGSKYESDYEDDPSKEEWPEVTTIDLTKDDTSNNKEYHNIGGPREWPLHHLTDKRRSELVNEMLYGDETSKDMAKNPEWKLPKIYNDPITNKPIAVKPGREVSPEEITEAQKDTKKNYKSPEVAELTEKTLKDLNLTVEDLPIPSDEAPFNKDQFTAEVRDPEKTAKAKKAFQDFWNQIARDKKSKGLAKVYHGTDKLKEYFIIKEGLKTAQELHDEKKSEGLILHPEHDNPVNTTAMSSMTDPHKTYFFDNPEHALNWAKVVSGHSGVKPSVIEADIPDEELVEDYNMPYGKALKKTGGVPAGKLKIYQLSAKDSKVPKISTKEQIQILQGKAHAQRKDFPPALNRDGTSNNKWIKDANLPARYKYKSVAIADIFPQESLEWKDKQKVAEIAESGEIKKPILLWNKQLGRDEPIKNDNDEQMKKYALRDGHHRFLAAQSRGDTHIMGAIEEFPLNTAEWRRRKGYPAPQPTPPSYTTIETSDIERGKRHYPRPFIIDQEREQ